MTGYSREPTARGDEVAEDVREWYEAHRETWRQRWRRREDCADEFMLALINEVLRIHAKANKEPLQ